MRIASYKLTITTGLALALLLSSQTWAEKDTREVVVLNSVERGFMFREMRGYVEGIKKMVDALAKDDIKSVAGAVRPLGMASMANVPPTLMQKVPGPFMQLGMPTHMAFDQIANAAEKGADSKTLLIKLGAVMNNCVACHAKYQIKLGK